MAAINISINLFCSSFAILRKFKLLLIASLLQFFQHKYNDKNDDQRKRSNVRNQENVIGVKAFFFFNKKINLNFKNKIKNKPKTILNKQEI